MRLPRCWNQEIKTLETRLNEIWAEKEAIGKALVEETKTKGKTRKAIEKIIKSYTPQRFKLDKEQRDLGIQLENTWENVREKYPLKNPPRKRRFATTYEAAEVIAYYWQGQAIPQKRLIQRIIRYGADPTKTYQEALDYAGHLTSPHSPERASVEAANRYLWKNKQKGVDSS